MSEERKEKLFNKLYYDYLEREEAQEVIDYMLKLEKEIEELKKENTYYKYKLLNGNSNLQELKENIENENI